jgi:hypothetical protein
MLQDDTYKVSVIKYENKLPKFEESSLFDMNTIEENKNEEERKEGGSNLFLQIVKSINLKVNNTATPGGGNDMGTTPGGPPVNTSQHKNEMVT